MTTHRSFTTMATTDTQPPLRRVVGWDDRLGSHILDCGHRVVPNRLGSRERCRRFQRCYACADDAEYKAHPKRAQ